MGRRQRPTAGSLRRVRSVAGASSQPRTPEKANRALAIVAIIVSVLSGAVSVLLYLDQSKATADQQAINRIEAERYERRFVDRVTWWAFTDNEGREVVNVENLTLAPLYQVRIDTTVFSSEEGVYDQATAQWRAEDIEPCSRVTLKLADVDDHWWVSKDGRLGGDRRWSTRAAGIIFRDGQNKTWKKGGANVVEDLPDEPAPTPTIGRDLDDELLLRAIHKEKADNCSNA